MPRVENDTVPYPYSLQYEKIKHLEMRAEMLSLLTQEQARAFDHSYQMIYGNPYFADRRGESWIVRKREAEASQAILEGILSGVHWTTGISIPLVPHADSSLVESLLLSTEDYYSCLVWDQLFLIPTEKRLVEQVEYRLIERFFNHRFSKEDLERAVRAGKEASTIVTLGLREFNLLDGQTLDDLLTIRATGFRNVRFFWRIVGYGCAIVHIQVTVDPKEVLCRLSTV